MSPLPFAPPPKDSSLYQQLESTTLQTLTADQLDTIRAKTFSQGTEGNEDEYRRLLLLGLAANQLSLSGPIANAGAIKQYIQTSNTDVQEIKPPKGEVWNIQAISIHNTASLSTNQTYYFYMSDDASVAASAVPSTSTDVWVSSYATSSTVIAWETFHEDFNKPILATNSMYPRLYGNFSGVGAGEEVYWQVSYVRVR